MAVENPLTLLQSIERDADNRAFLYDAVSRVTPAAQCFEFQSMEEFMGRASSILGMTFASMSASMCGSIALG